MRKRILAFVLAMVMTCVNICMVGTSGILAYAEGIDTEEAGISIKAVAEAKAGEQVTIEVVANKEMYWNSFKLCLNLNSEKLKAEKEEIQAIPENYDSKYGKWQIWKYSSDLGLVDNWIEKDNNYLIAGAVQSMYIAKIEKDAVLLSLKAEAKVDLKAGDVIATCTLPEGYTDDRYEEYDPYRKKEVGLSVDCKVAKILVNGEDMISAEEMKKLVEKNKTEDVAVETSSGITFTFKKGSMDNAEIADSIDFGTTINHDYGSLVNAPFEEGEHVFTVTYNYEGKLPGEAQISIPVDDSLTGKRLYYYEVGENGEYKYMSRTTVAKDGTYTVKQNECSGNYVATTKAPESLGDCDGDGLPTTMDALAILNYVVENPQGNFYPELADCDGEDGITAKDALAVLKYNVGIRNEFY